MATGPILPGLLLLIVRLKQLLDVLQRLPDAHREPIRVRRRAALLGRHVEEYNVLAGNNVRHSVPIIGHRPETTSGTDKVRVLARVQLVRLPVRRLAGGQAPRLAEHLLQERRVHLQVLGHDEQAEQVTIDSLAAHRILVATLVLQTSRLQQFHALGGLQQGGRRRVQ